jgi:bleomycin hydrolase
MTMKKQIAFGLCLLLLHSATAQKQEAYEFKEFKKMEATPIKNQGMSGTCWSFSTASFLESEAIRLGKGAHDLSEMFVVRHVYRQKCENYVRRQGHAQFGEGGLAHDLLNAVKRHGIVPESVYPGRKDEKAAHNHSKLEKSLRERCKVFVEEGKKGTLSERWLSQVDSILDAEFGPLPTQFNYNGTVFTPVSFREYLGINPDDYVSLSSFTHHPFYEKFILEIPDNFANGYFYNVPLSELTRCANYAIQQGYTVEWDADVSNPGFSPVNGIAIVPERSWDQKDADAQARTFKYWEPERHITQEYRQQLFDRQVTMDDHLMHIVGLLDEAHSGVYYVVKNSWGEISDLKGYVYVSEAYMRQNTISFTIHQNAIPQDLRRRLGLEQGDIGVIKNAPAPGMQKMEAPKPAANKKSDPNKPKLDRAAVKKAQQRSENDH